MSSEGKTGDDVFGTRGRWATLSGKIGTESVTIAILDHPRNPGHPAYWFARGYGLFAANPFGRRAYSVERKVAPPGESNYRLAPHASVTFRHSVQILSGPTTAGQIEVRYRRFVSGK
jgi:hypothetical protein